MCTHAADHTDHKDQIVVLEVLEPERIIFQYLDPVPKFLPTMVFAQEAGKARLTWRQRFESTAHGNQVTPLIVEANG